MANESLVIQQNDARMTVIGKSWPDVSTDSGGGDWDDTYNGTYSGPIPRTDLPTKIAVTTPPTKTEYSKLDRIDFDGMVVTAYNDDGSVWTNNDYPDGTIPLNEIISTRTVPNTGSSGGNDNIKIGSYYRGNKNHKFLLCNHLHISGYWYAWGHNRVEYDISANDGFSIIVLASNPYYNTQWDVEEQDVFAMVLSTRVKTLQQVPPAYIICARGTIVSRGYSFIYKSDSAIFSDVGYYAPENANYYSRPAFLYDSKYGVGSFPLVSGSITSNLPLSLIYGGLEDAFQDQATLTISYCKAGDIKDISDVTLYWQRPGDGLYLSCTLPIFIKSDNSD